MKPDQERVKNLLTDTVTLLCKNGLHYQKELKVQGLLGITTDEDEVFIVHINEKFGDLIGSVGISINTQDNDTVSDIALSTAALANASNRDRAPKKDRHIDLTERREHHHHRFAERVRNRKRPSEDSSSPCVSSPISSPRGHSQHSRSGQPSPSVTTSTPMRHHDDISSTQSPGDPLSAAQPTVKIKKEEEDVIILDKNSYCQEGGSQSSDTNIPRHGEGDSNTIQQNYGGTMGLSLEEIQSGFPQFDAIDSSLQNDVKPPPAKRRVSATVAGSSEEHVSGEVGPGVGVGGPFITGMVQNVRGQGELEDSQTSGASWDNSSLGPLTQDGQVLLEGAPGCSTWDSSQMQMSVMRSQGATGQTGESSESPVSALGGSLAKWRPERGRDGFSPTTPESRHTPSTENDLWDLLKRRNYLPCFVCGRNFAYTTGLYEHMRKIHNVGGCHVTQMLRARGKSQSCPVAGCDRAFLHDTSLFRHLKIKHLLGPKTPIVLKSDRDLAEHE